MDSSEEALVVKIYKMEYISILILFQKVNKEDHKGEPCVQPGALCTVFATMFPISKKDKLLFSLKSSLFLWQWGPL